MTSSAIPLLFASRDGQTRKIVERLHRQITTGGCAAEIYDLVVLSPSEEALSAAPCVVVIAPIRFGYHLPQVELLLRSRKKTLEKQKLVMVSVNLTARKSEKNTPETNPYFIKWIKRHRVRPVLAEVFAGRLEYRLYKTWERWVIRFIMFLTGGPTNFDAAIDYTDWDKVDALARRIAALNMPRREAA